MSRLIYHGHEHKITLVDHHGHKVGSWPAYNNIDTKFAAKGYGGETHLHNGIYKIDDFREPHRHDRHQDNKDGIFGSYGIIRFNYNGHPGVGVHAGRAHDKRMPGPKHATHGCIRTTDLAMKEIVSQMQSDHLKTIQIMHNTHSSAHHGKSKAHHVHKTHD